MGLSVPLQVPLKELHKAFFTAITALELETDLTSYAVRQGPKFCPSFDPETTKSGGSANTKSSA